MVGIERPIGNDSTGRFDQEREPSTWSVVSRILGESEACFEITEKPDLIPGDLWAVIEGRRPERADEKKERMMMMMSMM
jgi:hypothetical protein